MKTHLFSVCFSFVWLALSVAGCGSDHEPTYTVTGEVTLNGEPLANAEVTFLPQSAEGKPARGKSDDQGNYRLSTYIGPGEDARGAMAGSYRITIRAVDDASQKKIVTYDELASRRTDQLPAKYGDPEKSGFAADVAAGGKNEFNFDLQKP